MSWNTPPDWPTPRDSWSPALERAKEKVRLLLSLIPDGIHVKTKGFCDIPSPLEHQDLKTMFAFVVALPGYEKQSKDWYGKKSGQCFISSDATVRVTPFIYKLLTGKVEGYEDCVRWPWDTEQPPDPPGYKPRIIKVYP
jgi:hypothetical protein